MSVTVVLIVVCVVWAVSQIGPTNLKIRFAQAGALSGRSKADIIAAVGNPTSVSGAPNGGSVLQWINTSAGGAYHVALLFDANGVCVGVTHEHDGTR